MVAMVIYWTDVKNYKRLYAVATVINELILSMVKTVVAMVIYWTDVKKYKRLYTVAMVISELILSMIKTMVAKGD